MKNAQSSSVGIVALVIIFVILLVLALAFAFGWFPFRGTGAVINEGDINIEDNTPDAPAQDINIFPDDNDPDVTINNPIERETTRETTIIDRTGGNTTG